jgi:hypothetical protein
LAGATDGGGGSGDEGVGDLDDDGDEKGKETEVVWIRHDLRLLYFCALCLLELLSGLGLFKTLGRLRGHWRKLGTLINVFLSQPAFNGYLCVQDGPVQTKAFVG